MLRIPCSMNLGTWLFTRLKGQARRRRRSRQRLLRGAAPAPWLPHATLGRLCRRGRGIPRSAGVARLAALHHRRATGRTAAPAVGKAAPAEPDRHAGQLPATGPRLPRRHTRARHRRLRSLDPRQLRPDDMRRRSIAEVLTGAVVLLVAAGFLAYAVAHSGRTTSSGYTLYAQVRSHRRSRRGRRCAPRRRQGRQCQRGADRSAELPGCGGAVGAR